MAEIAQRNAALDIVLQIVYNLTHSKVRHVTNLATCPGRVSNSHSGLMIPTHRSRGV